MVRHGVGVPLKSVVDFSTWQSSTCIWHLQLLSKLTVEGLSGPTSSGGTWGRPLELHLGPISSTSLGQQLGGMSSTELGLSAAQVFRSAGKVPDSWQEELLQMSSNLARV